MAKASTTTTQSKIQHDRDYISVVGARENNLKSIDIDVPKNQLVVITGPSGSGKSSLAFDTIYAEGQRRYMESLSSYARQFISQPPKPDVDSISGLSPAISIDQRTTSKNPRSTVATITEIYDYMRVMFARVGTVYSPETGLPLQNQSSSSMIEVVSSLPVGTKLRICSPIIKGHKGEHTKELIALKKQGFQRIKIDGQAASLDEIPQLNKNKVHTIEVIVDRIVINKESANRLADSIETSLRMSEGVLHVDVVEIGADEKGNPRNSAVMSSGLTATKGETLIFSEKFSCPVSGFTLEEIAPRLFSFNSAHGACPACSGLGTEVSFNAELVVQNQQLSLKEGAIHPWYQQNHRYYLQLLKSLSLKYDFSLEVPYADLPEKIKNIIMNGTEEEISFTFDDGYTTYTVKKPFIGVIADLQKREVGAVDDVEDEVMDQYRNLVDCHVCHGYRLKKEALCVKVAGCNVGEICSLSIAECITWFQELPSKLTDTENSIAKLLIKEISARLGFLHNVGLDYLTLLRTSNTLSGGESQRIRLASQIGSGLCGVIYVLDEPSIGLHPSNNQQLIGTLKHLRELGNSVIVVEHDEETMMESDYLIDIGPEAGANGGRVVSHGTPQEVLEDRGSITGAFLSGREKIEVPTARRRYGKGQFLEIKNARSRNLKGIDVKFPLGMFVAVTGISGGGKSTLVIDTLYKAVAKELNNASAQPGAHDEITNLDLINKIIKIDQSPIGRTPRSNAATYTGMFSLIRDWFTTLPESKMRGYKSGRFSFNVKGGRCENCQGDGVMKIEMHFLPDVYITCDVCKGKRYNRETLEVKYKGKSIADILGMTVNEACNFFDSITGIKEKLHALRDVGLGYITIGQSATTLSGGEAQRVKLSKELSKKATGDTLYILDEPTTGLHSVDIKKLLTVLHKLVDLGNTVIVIEHNIDVIKTADNVIDVGPCGGADGGRVVSHGTPEEVANDPNSITGSFIKKALPKGSCGVAAKESRSVNVVKNGKIMTPDEVAKMRAKMAMEDEMEEAKAAKTNAAKPASKPVAKAKPKPKK